MLFVILITILLPSYYCSESFVDFSSLGKIFQPQDSIQLLIETTFESQMLCAFACNQQPSCHAFDYDSASERCRLFEGDLTTGSIVSSTSATSIVGIVELFPSLFVKTHNQSCETCQESRYEICSTTTNTCQCRPNTFWDGSICALQLFTNDTCSQIDSCRKDQNLTCVIDSLGQFNRCSSIITTTTTITTSTTTITYTLPSICPVSISGNETLASFTHTGLVANNYSNYTFTFTAISSPRTRLVFAAESNPNNGWYLDNVSVRELGGSNNTQLVTNGDFSSNLTGWTLLCSSVCSVPPTRNQSLVKLTDCPSDSMAPCYYAECKSPTYVYLMQSLATTIGNIYNLSFSMAPASPSSDNLIVSIA